MSPHARTTYMGQIMAYEHQKEPDPDVATRTGEFAMLIYSIGTSPFVSVTKAS